MRALIALLPLASAHRLKLHVLDHPYLLAVHLPQQPIRDEGCNQIQQEPIRDEGCNQIHQEPIRDEGCNQIHQEPIRDEGCNQIHLPQQPIRDEGCNQRPSTALSGPQRHTHLLQLCLPTTNGSAPDEGCNQHAISACNQLCLPTTNGSAPRQAHRVADVLVEAHDALILTRVLRQVPAHLLWGGDGAVRSTCMQAVPRYPRTCAFCLPRLFLLWATMAVNGFEGRLSLGSASFGST
jgi:hypothetical protein